MSEQMRELAERAVKAGWPRLAGQHVLHISATCPAGVIAYVRGEEVTIATSVGSRHTRRADVTLPDFDDAGTRGHLLQLVRERWGCASASARAYRDDDWGLAWHIVGGPMEMMGRRPSEAEALVAALEAAPCG